MLHCLRSSSSRTSSNLHFSSAPRQGNLTDDTPGSSTQSSPTVNLTREYNFAVRTNSYREIWFKIHPNNSSYREIESVQLESHEEQQLLEQILQPSRECVQEALKYARLSTLTHLVSAYFDQSERTSRLCLILQQGINCARFHYARLHALLDILPQDFESNSLSQSQCDQAFDVFLQFDCLENPFSCPDSHNFHDMRRCFSQLKKELDFRLSKSHSRIRLFRHATTGSAICLIGTAVGVAISAVIISTHALVVLVAGPFLPALLPSKITKKELAHLAQLNAADKGTFFLQNDLDTIDRLVSVLHNAVESDKGLIRLGLERCGDKHPIQEVVKKLRKNHLDFCRQIMDLEERLCICLAGINRGRSDLLHKIHPHQTHCS